MPRVLQTKHVKPQREGESGQITQRESPIHHSNVMHYSKEQKTRSRVGYKCVRLLAAASLLPCFICIALQCWMPQR